MTLQRFPMLRALPEMFEDLKARVLDGLNGDPAPTAEDNSIMTRPVPEAAPAIDRTAPVRVETATFAMG